MSGYTLWGAAHSLYTGKPRSFLIKKGLDFVERCPSDPEFAQRILPSIGHFVVPVLEEPDGTLIQDSGDIIDWLEARHPEPVLEPECGVQRLVSLIFDAFGSEYMLPLAMHYRWSYRDQQEAFLCAEFGRATVPQVGRAERRAAAAQSMAFFAGFLPRLGVTSDVIPAMETSYLELIDALDEHFEHHPYLLGGRPCRGDFGLMAPLFAHLGRDPVPAGLMKNKAPNLFRWTERMNNVQLCDGEFPNYPDAYCERGTVPKTLEVVLEVALADWAPGLLADADCFNDWAADMQKGSLVSESGERQAHPNVGTIQYPWRGVTMRRASQPHMLWMFSAAQMHFRQLDGAEAVAAEKLLCCVGGQKIMDLQIDRVMMRENNDLILSG